MNLFAYGTLTVSEVFYAVTGDMRQGIPAMLTDYACRRVVNQCYPGIFFDQGACTQGVLYPELHDSLLSVLDIFEGELYQRKAVSIEVNQSMVIAWTYMVREAYLHLLTDELWDREYFIKHDLAGLLSVS